MPFLVALGITPKDKWPDDCSTDGRGRVPLYLKAQYGLVYNKLRERVAIVMTPTETETLNHS